MPPILSTIIPVYKEDDHLAICRLSILGQVQLKDIEVISVPVKECGSLYDALQRGITAARGSYILFLNQTDTIASAGSLVEAVQTAESSGCQVLLAPMLHRTGINALSHTERSGINRQLLPQELKTVFSINEGGAGTLLSRLPVPYGNIYKRSYLTALFKAGQPFGNAGDLMVAIISLLHAERISLCDTPVIENRYEDFYHPDIAKEELLLSDKKLTVQIMMMLGESGGKTIAHNILVAYLSWIISSYHPFSTFCHTKDYHKDIILPMTDMTQHDAIPALYPYWRYLQMVAVSTGDDLIEAYSLSNYLLTYESNN